MKPLYVMLVGLPASGKSTLAREIVAQYPAAGWHMISTDDFIEVEAQKRGASYDAVFKDVIDAATKDMNERRAYSLGLHGNIIHDQTNLTVKSRARKLEGIPTDYVKIGLFCDCGDMERRQRLAARPGKAIPEDVDAAMRLSLAPISTGEFDVIAVADRYLWVLDPYLAVS